MRVRSALFLAAVAAASLLAAAPAQADCQYDGDLASVCAGYDEDRRCVYAGGHVDVYPYRVACSPR